MTHHMIMSTPKNYRLGRAVFSLPASGAPLQDLYDLSVRFSGERQIIVGQRP